MKSKNKLTDREAKEIVLAVPVEYWKRTYGPGDEPRYMPREERYSAEFQNCDITLHCVQENLMGTPIPKKITLEISRDNYLIAAYRSNRKLSKKIEIFREISGRFADNADRLRTQSLPDVLKSAKTNSRVVSKMRRFLK